MKERCRSEEQREGTTGTPELQGESVSHASCAPHGELRELLTEVGMVAQLLMAWGKTAHWSQGR